MSLQDKLANANRYLRGHLSRAVRICKEGIPEDLRELEALCRRIPEPPLCKLALRAARNTGDLLQDDFGEHSETWQALERLRSAKRTDLPAAWRHYLDLQIEVARRRLGPAQEGQEPTTLLDRCESNQQELKELCDDIGTHIARIRDRSATRSSQAIFDELLSRAEAIDQENPDVRAYRGRYERRRSLLERRGD